MTEQIAQPKTILVTGGLGYLGSQLIRDLAVAEQFNGWTIRILDNLQSGQYRALMRLPDGRQYQFVEGDILDPSALRLALGGVTAVVHLAAVVRTPMSFERSQWVEQVNHWGTRHLLEASLQAGVKQFVFASSAAVYGPGGPYRETDRCRPQGAYAQSKRRAEEAILVLARHGDLQPTILRLGTLFGLAPVTRFEAVANRLAYLTGVRRSLTVYGSGEQRRTLIHAADASRAIIFCLAQPGLTGGQLLNVTSENISILELVELLRQAEPAINVRFTEQDIRTHLSFEADNSGLTTLGWHPQVKTAAGLAELAGQFSSFRPVLRDAPDLE